MKAKVKQMVPLVILGILLIGNQALAKYTVLSRNASDGGLFGYRNTSCVPTIFELVDGLGRPYLRTGYAVNCCEPGYSSCPKLGTEFLPINPPNDWDETQINQVNELIQNALSQIKSGVSDGQILVKVNVQNEAYCRVYEIKWNTEKSITVTRDDIFQF